MNTDELVQRHTGWPRFHGNCFTKVSTNVQVLDLWPPTGVISAMVADVDWETTPAIKAVVHSQRCQKLQAPNYRENEASYETTKKLLSVELLAPSLARAKSLNGFLSTLARVLCTWRAGSVHKDEYLLRYRNVQRMKCRLFTKILTSLGPVTEFLLTRMIAVRRRAYVINGIWFCLARPRLGSKLSGEVLLIPSQSMLYKALVRDVHQRFHNSRINVQKMTLDSVVLGIPDTGEEQLRSRVHNCAQCAFAERSDAVRARPPAPMPAISSRVSIWTEVTFDSFGPVRVRVSERNLQMQKSWVTCFLCMHSRMTNLVVHYGMSSEDFSHALMQHVATCGPPARLCLDNLAAQLAPLEEVAAEQEGWRNLTDVEMEDLEELERLENKQAKKIKDKLARARFTAAAVEKGSQLFSVQLTLSAPGSPQEKCLGENIFRSIGHFLGLAVHYPVKVPTIIEMATLVANVQMLVNNRPLSLIHI